jgi:hypothetical protein
MRASWICRVRAWSIPRCPWAVDFPDFFFFLLDFLADLEREEVPDFDALWELEEDLPLGEEAAAAPALVISSQTAATTSDWRIRRLKRKLGTSGETYEFLYSGSIVNKCSRKKKQENQRNSGGI